MTDQPAGNVGLCPAVTDSIIGSSHNHHLTCTLLASHAGLHRDPSGANWGPTTDGLEPSVLPATWRDKPSPGEVQRWVKDHVKLGGLPDATVKVDGVFDDGKEPDHG